MALQKPEEKKPETPKAAEGEKPSADKGKPHENKKQNHEGQLSQKLQILKQRGINK